MKEKYERAIATLNSPNIAPLGAGRPMNGLISLIVTTYNRPDALDAVLRSLARQSDRQFEVLIADDGSGPETAALIASWQGKLGLALHHIWQDDHGFRAAEARNRALAAAKGALVIFLDGDCLARPGFIARHRALAEPGWFVFGNRLLVSKNFTSDVLSQKIAVECWPLRRLFSARLMGKVNRLAPMVHMGDGAWRRMGPQKWQGVRTCNMAAWRSDLLRVDGLDGAFQGWGLEDSDLAIRLLNSGVKRKDGRFATGVLHLWHKEADRASYQNNRARLDLLMASKRIRAGQGLSSLGELPVVEGQ